MAQLAALLRKMTTPHDDIEPRDDHGRAGSGMAERYVTLRGMLPGGIAKEFTQSDSPTSGITAYGNAAPAKRKKKRRGVVRLVQGPLGKGRTVDEAAHLAATSDLNLLRKPTPAQAEAGNYRKGHVVIGGQRFAIENAAGTRRRPEWPPMQAHYGYAKGSEGADGDAVDVFIRPGTPENWNGTVFAIDQTDGDGGFDEHKVMVGYDNQREAQTAYLAHYPAGWELGPVTPLSMAAFKAWLRSGDTTAPLATVQRVARVRLRHGASLLRLTKYSPDQSRDDHGRWTGDGGGGASDIGQDR